MRVYMNQPKTADDFKNLIDTLEIDRWILHNCSFCSYQCGFVFQRNGRVYYDNGCICTNNFNNLRISSFEEVAEHYNIQKDESCIKEMNEFWGFK